MNSTSPAKMEVHPLTTTRETMNIK